VAVTAIGRQQSLALHMIPQHQLLIKKPVGGWTNFQEAPRSGLSEKYENAPSTGCSQMNPSFLEGLVTRLLSHPSIRVRMQVHLPVHPVGHRMPVVQMMLAPVRSYVSGTSLWRPYWRDASQAGRCQAKRARNSAAESIAIPLLSPSSSR
jgi:hypothetical protein